MTAPHVSTASALSRRAFLKGVGVLLSLPMLEAMTPAFARTAAAPLVPRRLVTICAGLGFHAPYFFPQSDDPGDLSSPYLDVLADFRGDFTVFSGLSHPEQNGANGHASGLTWLTGARRPGLPGFRNSVSLDQLIAQRIGHQTREPYLALATHGGSLSWTPGGVAIPAETSPAKVFTRLFLDGSSKDVQGQLRELRRGRSILDTVGGEAKKLHRNLGARDQEKLDQYLTSVRDLERRLGERETWATSPKPRPNVPPPTDIENRNDAIGRTRLMNDLIALALENDSTRTITLNLAGLNSVPVVDGVSQDWHNLSHHGRDEAKIEELKLIELAEFAAFRDFLARLRSVREGDATLLDQTTVLLGSNLGNASAHDWRNLPILVAGGGYRHGRRVAFNPKSNERLSNLFVMLAQRMGVEAEEFGGSTRVGVAGFEPA